MVGLSFIISNQWMNISQRYGGILVVFIWWYLSSFILNISGALFPVVSVGVYPEYKLALYRLTLSEVYCVRITILYPYNRIA